jgi:hypothetical protein
MTQDASLNGWMGGLQPRRDRKAVIGFPNALLLREPECIFAEECLVATGKSSAAHDDLHDVPLADFPQQWQCFMTEPVTTVLD